MDHDAVLAHPIWQVFGHLADPARLGDWLPGATAIHTAHGTAAFTLRLSRDPAQAAADELIGYEPPWQLAYRLLAGPDTHVLRITCTTAGAGTRVHIGQASPSIHPSTPVWRTTMPAPTRSPRSRPHGAPADYLARPASVWITAFHRQPPAGPQ